jgi:hypothetical protein
MSNVEENNVTAEETEASREIDLESFGITPSTDPIETLLKFYNENVDIVKAYTKRRAETGGDANDPTNVIKAELGKMVKADETKPIREAISSGGTNLAERIFSRDYDLVTSDLMLNELKTLVSMMEDERQYHFDRAVQAEKDKLGIKSTPAESAVVAKLTAMKLDEWLRLRIQMAKLEGKGIPENLFKTGGERNGFNTDVYPRLPKLDVDGPVSSTNSTHLVFRFKASGSEEIVDCAETTLNDVAHNVISQGAYRISGKTVAKKLKDAKLGIGATDEEWQLEFKTGVLFGKKA